MSRRTRTIPIFLVNLVTLLGVDVECISARQVSIHLFDRTRVIGTGPTRPIDQTIPFRQTSLILTFEPGGTAVISSTPDGKGPIVIDNFITVNGVNVCEGVAGQLGRENCFGHVIQDPGDPRVLGVPIETVLTPVPPIDVSKLIPAGTSTVLFELRDFGGIAGNTELFLVTTATPQPEQQSLAIDSDGSRAIIATTSSDGRPLVLDYTLNPESRVFRSLVTLANTPVVEMLGTLPEISVTHPPVTNVRMRFSRALVGAFDTTFVSEGNILTAQIDGRRITPVPITFGMESPTLTFVDGGPPPPLNISPPDANALIEFTSILETRGPDSINQKGRSCRSDCVMMACDALAREGVPATPRTGLAGEIECSFPPSAQFRYKALFDQCWNLNCNLLRWVLVEVPTGPICLVRRLLREISD